MSTEQDCAVGVWPAWGRTEDWGGSVMAISPLFWNNGWSLQLSPSRIALDSLIPLMHCATRRVGVYFRHFRNVVEGLWWLHPSQYSETLSNQFLFFSSRRCSTKTAKKNEFSLSENSFFFANMCNSSTCLHVEPFKPQHIIVFDLFG